MSSLFLAAARRPAGVDEAGRGPLAGPVVAAAVILDPDRPIDGLADSKQLAEADRLELAALVRARAVSWAVAWADTAEVDALNILYASMLAMRRAVGRLGVLPDHVVVDGNRCPRLGRACSIEAIVGGDGSVPAISAASILAKTWRDEWMARLAQRYPGYGFERHKGYGTPGHLAALARLGPCALHRRSFAPVAELLARQAG